MDPDRAALPYRPGVGIVVFDASGLVFVGRRARRRAFGRFRRATWQFPQGGIEDGEAPLEAARRELREETGLQTVRLLAEMPGTVAYDLPGDLRPPPRWAARYRGQRQHWFAMRALVLAEVDLGGRHAEFDQHRWIRLDEAISGAVSFKREVYARVGAAFAGIGPDVGADPDLDPARPFATPEGASEGQP